MFRLTIDLPTAPPVSVHPGREDARAALLRFLTETGHTHRVIGADWTHTTYAVTGQSDPGLIVGRAAIDELCICDHTHREHDDIGCTQTALERVRVTDCACRRYEPVPADPTLFELDTCRTAAAPRPT